VVARSLRELASGDHYYDRRLGALQYSSCANVSRPCRIIADQIKIENRRNQLSWKKLASRVVFDNPWMTVFEDRVINPGGGENQYGHVHFKKKAIAIVPIDEQGNTWIVGQDRYTLGSYSWEVPMGGSDPGETLQQTALRELREETGLRAGKLTQLMRVHTTNSITDEEGFVFVAHDLIEGDTEFDEEEVLAIRKLPLQDAIEMALSGEITDAMSVAALLRCAIEAQQKN